MPSNFRLDLYERKERLGSGAFGTVFRYWETTHDSPLVMYRFFFLPAAKPTGHRTVRVVAVVGATVWGGLI